MVAHMSFEVAPLRERSVANAGAAGDVAWEVTLGVLDVLVSGEPSLILECPVTEIGAARDTAGQFAAAVP